MTKRSFHPDHALGSRSQRGATLPWIFFGFFLVAAFFFFTEHRAHLMGALPFILLALCPLMHFLHRGHGGHGGPGHRHGSTGSVSPDAPGAPPTSSTAQRPPHQQ